MTTTTLIALLASASAGQAPLGDDIVASSLRVHELDIVYDPKTPKSDLEKIELVWSDDRGQTWHAQPAVTPDAKAIKFEAKGDGLYYLSMVMFTKSGRRIPADFMTAPPEVKLLIDSTKPTVTLPVARRVGDEVQLEWAIDDKHPNDARTQVVYRRSKSTEAWTLVPFSSFRGRTVTFAPKFAGPIEARVDVSDYAGNTDGVAKELPGGEEAGGIATASYRPPPVKPNAVEAAVPAASLEPIPPPSMSLPPGATPLIAPPSIAPTPAAPLPAVAPPSIAVAPAALPQPVPQAALPELAPTAFTPVGAAPVFTPSAAPPTPEAKAFNTTHFDVAYEVDGGSSGVSRVDVYVTRDDGRTWRRWSQHPQGERPLKIALDQSFHQRNPQPEGDYGFKLVPTSGAGLSEGAPSAGTPPEFRARIDLTLPRVDVFMPQADPAQRNAMLLRWRVTDANKSAEPVTIEWAETPAGPWSPVAGTASHSASGDDTLLWLLPDQTPPKVFLKFTAVDAAGNKLVTVSNQAFLVDPHRPTARIQGFAATPAALPGR